MSDSFFRKSPAAVWNKQGKEIPMMYIGIYTPGDNTDIPNYAGLYRGNDLAELDCGGDSRLKKALADYYGALPGNGIYAPCCAENLNIMDELCGLLAQKGIRQELLLFTDAFARDIPKGFTLLGYDICSDSMCYSPLGDGFLNSYDPNARFFQGMDYAQYKTYKAGMNGFGLLGDLQTAVSFGQYCTAINRQYPHAVESEGRWRPFAVYVRNMR